jgi:hypothetical protein
MLSKLSSTVEPTPFDDGDFYDVLTSQMADYDLEFFASWLVKRTGRCLISRAARGKFPCRY